jgi:hypothetical protein
MLEVGRVAGSIPDEVFFFFFAVELILPAALYGPGVDSAYNRNEYQESYWGVNGGRPARDVYNLTAICEPIV